MRSSTGHHRLLPWTILKFFTGDADFVPIVIHGECILAYTPNLEGSRQRSMQSEFARRTMEI